MKQGIPGPLFGWRKEIFCIPIENLTIENKTVTSLYWLLVFSDHLIYKNLEVLLSFILMNVLEQSEEKVIYFINLFSWYISQGWLEWDEEFGRRALFFLSYNFNRMFIGYTIYEPKTMLIWDWIQWSLELPTRAANFQVVSGNPLGLQLISRWQKSDSLEKMAALEDRLYSIISCWGLFPCQTSPSSDSTHKISRYFPTLHWQPYIPLVVELYFGTRHHTVGQYSSSSWGRIPELEKILPSVIQWRLWIQPTVCKFSIVNIWHTQLLKLIDRRRKILGDKLGGKILVWMHKILVDINSFKIKRNIQRLLYKKKIWNSLNLPTLSWAGVYTCDTKRITFCFPPNCVQAGMALTYDPTAAIQNGWVACTLLFF